MMVEALPAGAVKTFSIGFDERSFDESAHARRVARALRHRPPRGRLHAARSMLELLPTVADVLDEPFADASILPTYLLSRFTRESVTVALGGDGGDELLAGYPTFPAERVARLYPRAARCCTSASCCRSPTACPSRRRTSASTSSSSASSAARAHRRTTRHATWLGSFTPDEQERAARRAPSGSVRGAAARIRERADRRPPRAAHLPLREDLPPGRHPGEGRPGEHGVLARGAGAVPRRRARRVPRPRARRVSSSAGSTPSTCSSGRWRDVLPPGIADRPKKGFGIPVAEWLKGELRERAAGRAVARAAQASRGSSIPPTVRLLVPSTSPAGATIESRSGRCSSSSSGTGAGSRAAATSLADARRADAARRAREAGARRGPRLSRSRRDPLVSKRRGEAEVETGELVCDGCGRDWPIRGGIPRLVPPDLVEQQTKTASAFGWQWQHFAEMHPEFEAQFLDWIASARAGVLPGKARARRGLRHRPARATTPRPTARARSSRST